MLRRRRRLPITQATVRRRHSTGRATMTIIRYCRFFRSFSGANSTLERLKCENTFWQQSPQPGIGFGGTFGASAVPISGNILGASAARRYYRRAYRRGYYPRYGGYGYPYYHYRRYW